MKKIIYILLAVFFGLIPYACVDEEKDKFELPAAERMNKILKEYKDILTSAEHGWISEYYPEKNHSIGGYAMICKFHDDGKVDVMCEIETNQPAQTNATSSYAILPEQGPMLSFNTYNPVMHYFTEPSSADVDGMAGDYEFIILEATNDQIIMKGKKYENKLVFKRADGTVSSEKYLQDVEATSDDVAAYGLFNLIVNNQIVGKIVGKDRTFNITFTEGNEKNKTIEYSFSPDGIILYEPFTINDVTMESFRWDWDKKEFICTDPGVDIVIQGYYPDDYEFTYEEFIGEWKIKYLGKTFNESSYKTGMVTISTKRNNRLFTMEGSMFPFPVGLRYNAAKGTIDFFNKQIVHVFDKEEGNIKPGYYVWCLIYNRTDSGGTWGSGSDSNNACLSGIWNNDRDNIVIELKDNGKWAGKEPQTISFRLYDTNGKAVSRYDSGPDGAYISNITLTKIAD